MGVPDAEIAQAPRSRTAQAVEALVAGLVGKDATAALKHLAQARLDTSAAAMGTSLEKAAGVLAALDEPRVGAVRRGGPDPTTSDRPRPRNCWPT